ncbi:hypothetical protein [Streptomyces sp. AC495_CC817]|uniref:hypothetical protein n=1 Tax=Streptomyces sp. AC495_CC817 TaxID=2823900 RepID=UPI001C27C0EC|nr:hypothetical protein [Streptomyces sp. AC495_CC817]
MSTEGQHEEDDHPGWLAVLAVLAPILAGTTTAIFLLVGFGVKLLDPESAFAQALLSGGWFFGAITALAILLAAASLLITALRNRPPGAEEEIPASSHTRTPPTPGRAARRTVDIASFVAGRHRAHLRQEWAAVLAGDPGNGIVLSSSRRARYALGFLWAALRMRLRDVVAPVWLPVDWLLSKESRTNGLITAVVGTQAVYIQHADGLHTLLTEGWGWCAGCGIALRLLVGWLRRIRGIELASARENAEGG